MGTFTEFNFFLISLKSHLSVEAKLFSIKVSLLSVQNYFERKWAERGCYRVIVHTTEIPEIQKYKSI